MIVTLKQTKDKGKGVFASRKIEIGETVIIGEIEQELSENHSHASQIDSNRFVLHNKTIRMVNHSCNPNCGIEVNETGAHNFVAIRQINQDEEITFDYAMRNYTVDFFPYACQCNAINCRGTITGWKDLPASLKLKYKKYTAPYLLEMDLVPQ